MKPLLNNTKNEKNLIFLLRYWRLNLFSNPIEDTLKRGDVVSLVSPKDPDECLLKRVIGLPGDIVKTIRYRKKFVKVPEGHCWIEGDNYNASYDSNAFGCVPIGLIIGQAKLIAYPKLNIIETKFNIIKSDMPEHRRLKKLKSKSENYFVDLKGEILKKKTFFIQNYNIGELEEYEECEIDEDDIDNDEDEFDEIDDDDDNEYF